jgi:hypothetical protein
VRSYLAYPLKITCCLFFLTSVTVDNRIVDRTEELLKPLCRLVRRARKRPDRVNEKGINQELYRVIFAAKSGTLGEAALKAKLAVSDGDIRRTWILLGDPSMKLK